MSPEKFKQLTSIHQLDLILNEGREIMSRIFLFYNVKLFAVYDFFVEVWYKQTTNKVDRIVILDLIDVFDLYEKDIKLNDLTDSAGE